MRVVCPAKVGAKRQCESERRCDDDGRWLNDKESREWGQCGGSMRRRGNAAGKYHLLAVCAAARRLPPRRLSYSLVT